MAGAISKSILLVTRGKKNCQILTQELEDLLGDRVDVRGYCVDDPLPQIMPDIDLVVAATESILKLFPEELKGKYDIIVARRTIDFDNLYKLFNLPSKQKIMLVNDRKETAEEVISLLYGAGFDHLWLIPVYPELPNPPRTDIAITPGESHLVPPYVTKVIDIGTRKIDLSTMMEILFKFDLLDKRANLLAARYMSNIIDISRKLSNSLAANKNLVHLLEAIIQRINNGVIATDQAGKIVICNKIAEKMFGIKREEVLGQNADVVLPNLEINKPMSTGKKDENIEKLYQDKHILINRIPLEYDNAINGAVLTAYEFSEVEKIEKKLRKHVYSKGHVARYTFDDIDGDNPALRKQISNAKKFASLDMTVLIEGETGTGKELMAHAIHNASKRKKGPFVAINCAALPKDLLESELFGFEEGTFTGARKGGKPGLFEQAHLGTLFLDEIGEIPPEIQVKLLRAIEAKEVMRIGGDGLISVDVRIIAATNRNLKSLVAQKKFREDLYFRLNVLKVYIPPLRERKEDILPLMDSMLREYGKSVDDFLTEEIRRLLIQYNWPGNIRELRNITEFLIATVPDDRKARACDLPIDFQVHPDYQFPEEKPDSLAQKLEESTYLQEDLAILKIMSDLADYGRTIGRRRLKVLLNEAGIRTTEDRIRTRLKALEEQGLIKVSIGRSGSTITEKGRRIVQGNSRL
ncbi:MAG: sigma 54-interacting transcriptional regulator [Bacillota bacterium]|jgi:transcriptional regulator with PAS, ATPase and Fis domain